MPAQAADGIINTNKNICIYFVFVVAAYKQQRGCQMPKVAYSEQERAQIRKALLDYCCLDTLAMVRVHEELRRVSYNHKN